MHKAKNGTKQILQIFNSCQQLTDII